MVTALAAGLFLLALPPQSAGPELALPDLEGRPHSLQEFRQRIVVLNFWATWCAPCVREMPALARLQKRYGAQGVQVIGASADEAATRDKIPEMTRRLKISFPIWVGATTADMQKLGLGEALPATVILDRDGQIGGRLLGAFDPRELERRVQWLLGDRGGPPPPVFVDSRETGRHAEEEESHGHGGVGLEGASLVPS